MNKKITNLTRSISFSTLSAIWGRLSALCAAGLVYAVLPLQALAGDAPQYEIEILGPGIVINAMNDHGEVVGWLTSNGVQAFVTGPNHPHEVLPLPPGYQSAWAQGINNAGVIVGSAATGGYPEFGEALAWIPDGNGGYDVEFLGQLPGHTQSVAYAINNHGDIVGESIRQGSQGGPTVWFNSPQGVLNIAALGAPSSPKDINDERMVAGISGGLFDLDTLTAIPLPAFDGPVIGVQIWGLNNHNELAGTAFVGGTQRAAVRWTEAGGWEVLGGIFDQSASILAFDISDSRITVMETAVPGWFFGPAAHFDDSGLLPLEELVPGNWEFVPNWGEAVNNVGQIASIAINLDTNQSGVVILTPVSTPATLTNLEMVRGTLLEGGLGELNASEDAYVHTRSGFGQTLTDLHHMELQVNATTMVANPSSIDLTVEDRIDAVSGLGQVFLRNWSTNQFEQVGSYALGAGDAVQLFSGIDATDFVDGSGAIALSVKHTVFVPLFAYNFESFIDQVEVVVR